MMAPSFLNASGLVGRRARARGDVLPIEPRPESHLFSDSLPSHDGIL